ncbi:uncharacterized protein PHACADRAFT_257745 [Phanerochaete carnosa HHB-10118-sp]|uniref:SEC7 domain-containing protein n=1 Tax=Phanerochaete carnosa (strain HHB-10118-sp) TaxID=650164 RepID=K5VRJ1_PHACS|nr:uncharacterized protein PHACADRAFT_257745 [Phanerochaete carnosa HHB-10118-sp]EKM54123.1 hypothetical protein PHACADRAFT_257745 [Phanerochaete carnosa HHB-10118-sp]
MLKRAASLPRMKDGRRPPMHVQAVSEGERAENDLPDEESAPDSDEKPDASPGRTDVAERVDLATRTEAEPEAEQDEKVEEQPRQPRPEERLEDRAEAIDDKGGDVPPSDGPPERPSTPARKRRSRSRARSRGSKDLRNKPKTPPPVNNESSADEYVAEDVPPSPPVVSPIPSHFAAFPSAGLLRSAISPVPGMFYPMTSPSTPMMPPTLDEIQKGLFRSNSVGAQRMMAMSKLTGEPIDMSLAQTVTPLGRSNTVSGGERGERVAARRNLLRRLGERVEKADADQTSGTDDLSRPATPATVARKKKRRSRRSNSRTSTVLDDRDDREQTSTSPNTPVVLTEPLAPPFHAVIGDSHALPDSSKTPVQHQSPPDASMPLGGRGVVIEDEDEDMDRGAADKVSSLPTTPARRFGQRLPYISDVSSQLSSESLSAVPVPFYMSSQQTSHKQDAFPASPFATPLREKVYLVDEDEESDAYRELRAHASSRQAFPRDSDISWVAEPVPRMPINDDDEDDDDDAEEEPESEHQEAVPQVEEPEGRPSDDQSSQSYYPTSLTTASASKDLLVEIETSPEMSPSHIPPSPSSAIALSFSNQIEPTAVVQPPSPVYPRRLSVTTPVQQPEPSPLATEFQDWEDNRTDATPKRGGEGMSPWERVKGAFSRSNSSSGRRSRTNSIGQRDRRYNTDSSVSRESGASQTSATKGDRSSGVAQQPPAQAPGLMQSPSASASILSLAPLGAPPGGVSPVPAASSADLLKYQDSKLFPFPGMMKQLEEKRNKAKGLTTSASSPDIFSPGGIEATPSSSSSSSATTKVPEGTRDRKISHQVSDTRLFEKFSTTKGPSPVSSVPSSGSHADYFSLGSVTSNTTSGTSNSGSLKLPTNVEGVRKWLVQRRYFRPSQSSAPSTPSATTNGHSPSRPPPSKKPSLTALADLDSLVSRKDKDLSSDWEDIGSDKSQTPVSAATPLSAKRLDEQYPPQLPLERPEQPQGIRKAEDAAPSSRVVHANGTEITALPSPPEPPSSATPDPQSSLDEFPARSNSESFSSDMSLPNSPALATHDPSRAAVIMGRLDEALGRGSKSSIWPLAIDDPPRKLVLSSPVLQVANANTVKDRFLFLFTDVLVIAKPVIQDQDALLDATRPTPLDRKFIVKNVVLLRDLKFSSDREDSHSRTALTTSHMRYQVIRTFVHQFTKDSDMAISMLFDKSNARDDPIALGQLMFRAVELDRARLGEYLARRTSKIVLKAYVDSFGFAGLRIDKALRVFLLSICIPSKLALEYLLDAFASRWYEANAGIVAYDKDLAIRLARAIVQVNEVMHGGIAQTIGITGYPRRNVLDRDFIDAFRRYDPRGLVSDELLTKIYTAVRRERLSQSRTSYESIPDLAISLKRPLPPRLTYRMQSEPIVLRVPQPDPQLNIQLFGQDLMFDPPVLSFAKSAEASFRVTGTSLGPKTIVMWRSGPNALAYSGLPLSSPVQVERSFMRNTFQVAFKSHHGEKRKYMFSVDDPLIRHQWVVSLKRHIDIASARPPVAEASGSSLKVKGAIEAVTLRVLQDMLINSNESSHSGLSPSAVDHALAKLTRNASPYGNGFLNASPSNLHRRSKSRSQVYHRHGAGRHEPEFEDDSDAHDETFLRLDVSSSQRPGDKLWTANDLEVVCRQNSSIPSVLEYLHVDGAVS